MITQDQTLGDVATAHPEATVVFLRHRLDFCCGGGRKLAEACAARGLDPASVIAEINAEGTPAEPQRWETRPLPELIEHILIHYHEPLHNELPALVDAAKKVERVHGAKATCPHGLAQHLQHIVTELGQHMNKEERALFPALIAGSRGQQIHMPVRVMMQEHDDHGLALERTRELTSNFTPPPEACATWRALYAALEKLEAELMEHIHLENNILFPRGLSEARPS